MNPIQKCYDALAKKYASKTGASMARGQSKQDYPTPDDFMKAVRARFNPIGWDLAANASNAKSENYFTQEVDALKQPWHKLGSGGSHGHFWLWLNPPFGNIAPWVEKCWVESQAGAKILFLVPAAVGSNWFAKFVHNKARVLFLSPRICFDGKHPFPKDCMLCVFTPGWAISVPYETWRWKS